VWCLGWLLPCLLLGGVVPAAAGSAPIDKAMQVDNGGGHETSLGQWKGFEKSGTEVGDCCCCCGCWCLGVGNDECWMLHPRCSTWHGDQAELAVAAMFVRAQVLLCAVRTDKSM